MFLSEDVGVNGADNNQACTYCSNKASSMTPLPFVVPFSAIACKYVVVSGKTAFCNTGKCGVGESPELYKRVD